MTNKTYDVLKWIAQYLLPGLASLYFALSQIWGFPYGDEVMGSIMALDTFLGVLVGISGAKYSAENRDPLMPQPERPISIRVENGTILVEMSSDVYDGLIWVAQYFLPAVSTLFFALSGIWEFQYGGEIVGTIAAVDTFLGVVLGISNAQFKQPKPALQDTNLQ